MPTPNEAAFVAKLHTMEAKLNSLALAGGENAAKYRAALIEIQRSLALAKEMGLDG